MPISFPCSCGRILTVADDRKGAEKKCPDCGKVQTVPQASSAETPAGVSPAGSTVLSSPPLLTKPCPKCAQAIPHGAMACRHCGTFFDAVSDQVSARLQTIAPVQGLPCERTEVPFWSGMFQTLKLVWLSPRTAFSTLAAEPAIGRAMGFACIFGTLSYALLVVWMMLFKELLPEAPGAPPTPFSLGQGVVTVLLAPGIFVLGSFLNAVCVHLGLVMTGANRRDFATSLAISLYVNAAASLLLGVPACGIFAIFLWFPILFVLAVIHAHGAETWKAIVAVLWPLLLLCIPIGMILYLSLFISH